MKPGVGIALLVVIVAFGLFSEVRDASRDKAPTTAPNGGGLPERPASGEFPEEAPSDEASDDSPPQKAPSGRRLAPAAGKTPEQTLRRAAMLYGNWTSATAPTELRKLETISRGRAREDFAQIATQARTDFQQTEAGARSVAKVKTVAVRGAGKVRRATIVTRVKVSGEELGDTDAEYEVTEATVKRIPDGWVITRWSPQP